MYQLLKFQISSRRNYALTVWMKRGLWERQEEGLTEAWQRPGRWGLCPIFRYGLGSLLSLLQLLSPGVGVQDPGLLRSTASHVPYPLFLPKTQEEHVMHLSKNWTRISLQTNTQCFLVNYAVVWDEIFAQKHKTYLNISMKCPNCRCPGWVNCYQQAGFRGRWNGSRFWSQSRYLFCILPLGSCWLLAFTAARNADTLSGSLSEATNYSSSCFYSLWQLLPHRNAKPFV